MDLFNYQNQNIKNHFQRSTRIDNDLTKDFLDHFIFHSTGKKVLNQITSSINNSNQCAFTLTGPYGTGKSSLALFLQALLSSDSRIKKQAIKIANFSKTSGFTKLFLKNILATNLDGSGSGSHSTMRIRIHIWAKKNVVLFLIVT